MKLLPTATDAKNLECFFQIPWEILAERLKLSWHKKAYAHLRSETRANLFEQSSMELRKFRKLIKIRVSLFNKSISALLGFIT